MAELTAEEKLFCEIYSSTTDADRSARISGIPLGIRSARAAGEDLLNNQRIKDHLLMMSDAVDQDSVLRRLGIIRKQAWQIGDMKQVAAMEMNIADISGLKVIKTQNLNVNVGDAKSISAVSTEKLLSLLSTPTALSEISHQGLRLVDGRLDRDDGSDIYTEYEEIS